MTYNLQLMTYNLQLTTYDLKNSLTGYQGICGNIPQAGFVC